MSVLDERLRDLDKIVEHARAEQEIHQLGTEYQKSALDLEIAARKMIAEIMKLALERMTDGGKE